MSTGPGADSAPAPGTDPTTDDTPHGTGGTARENPASTGPVTAGDGADTTARPAGKPDKPGNSMFSSLRIRNYRLFAMGQVVSNTGTWMQRIAQDWLVFTLTGSATAVGLTVALQFLPMLLFGLYGGVLADRCAKRKLLIITQTAMGMTGIVLAVLTLTGHVEVWHVYATAFALGMITVVDNPTRQTFVSEMVGPDQLRNAVSLNSANFQSARLVGPAVAGVLITGVGSGWAFLLNGLSFLAPIAGLLLMRTSELHPIDPVPRGKGQLREGLRHVRSRPELIWPIVLVGAIGTFGFNFPIWLTAFTDHVFDQGAGAYSLLNVLMAAGSVTGALLAARRNSSRMRLMVAAAGLFGVLQIVAAVAPTYWLFALLMLPIGIMGLTFNVTANSSVQLAADPAMRGRVMSLFMMVFVGGTPIGGPLMGWITDTYGARIGFASGGLVSLLSAGLVGLALARAAGLRMQVRSYRVTFVPRDPRAAGITADTGTDTGTPPSNGPVAGAVPTAAAVERRELTLAAPRTDGQP
ncbi:MFS transporter [Streptomyces sp. XM4193]|uniref:MFS transporter n=1 Tax=Streptomyces sp. XM4193 TaxID=2929782 RepID=UPI001FF940E2|nr:MFS transporter [Streptomyces sp. XM4193]MCK1795351.1 MFS transporter [Streptomyces sp. XM4193]